MLALVIRKVKENNKCYIERVFPIEGNLSVEVGESVEPFDHLGDCLFSQNEIVFPKDFKPQAFRNDSKFYYLGSLLGKTASEKIYAPYDGTLSLNESKKYTFKETLKRYILLAGVWGRVKSILEKKSVLLETQTKDVLFAASTSASISGELLVFPNPTDILKKSYLEYFAKGTKGKIIYVGHFVGLDVVEKAIEMGASGIIAGSAHKEVFDFAKKKNFAFGLFSGFGKIKTPDNVYKLLSSVSYRFVFFEGDKNLLRIPLPAEEQPKEQPKVMVSTVLDPIKNVEPGMSVQVLQDPYFGWVGTVDRIAESSIFVKFGLEKKSVEIRVPNFFLVE